MLTTTNRLYEPKLYTLLLSLYELVVGLFEHTPYEVYPVIEQLCISKYNGFIKNKKLFYSD
jgi:hypothetical protein